MAHRITSIMDAPMANGNGVPVDVRHSSKQTVYIGGTFVAGVTIQTSPDGTNWFTINGTSAPIVIEYEIAAAFFRIVITSYVSGTVDAQIVTQHNVM